MNIKYQGLELIAAVLKILAWVAGAIGFMSSIFLSISASALIPRIYLLMGGFIFTAISTGLLLAISESLYLLIGMARDLSHIAESKEKDVKS